MNAHATAGGLWRGGLAGYIATARQIAGARPSAPVLMRMLGAKALYGLSCNEYALFRLDRRAFRDLRHYFTKKQTTVLIARINDPAAAWQVEDKLAFHRTCVRAGVPVPALHALVCLAPPAEDPGVPALDGFPALLEHFRRQGGDRRFIVKPRRDALGTGVRFVALRGGRPYDIDGNPIDAAAFDRELRADMARDDYLVQSFVVPHPEVANLGTGKALGTVRVLTWFESGKASILYALVRIPAAGNPHDNFRGGASGNLLALVDHRTGIVGPAYGRRSTTPTRLLDAFDRNPDSGHRIKGVPLPLWTALEHSALRAAALFPGLPLLGWDFALSEDGVVAIEANANPDIIGVQVASGRGAGEILGSAFQGAAGAT